MFVVVVVVRSTNISLPHYIIIPSVIIAQTVLLYFDTLTFN